MTPTDLKQLLAEAAGGPTNIVAGREARVHRMSPGPERARLRSRSFPGMMQAAADQWGGWAEAQEAAR